MKVKLISSLGLLSLGTVTSADVLDTKIDELKKQGFDVKVEEVKQKVYSHDELMKKKDEENKRIIDEVLRLDNKLKQVNQAANINNEVKKEIDKKNRDIDRENERRTVENARLMKDWVERVRDIKENNTLKEQEDNEINTEVNKRNEELKKDYEKEIARLKKTQSELGEDYEKQKHDLDKINEKIKNENAERIRQVDSENARRTDVYNKEKARIAKVYEDAMNKYKADKTRVENENAEILKSNKTAEDKFKADMETYNRELEENKRKKEEYLKAVEAAKAEDVRKEEEYQNSLTVYNQKVKEITDKNKKAQDDYEASKKDIESKNAKIDADYTAAQKVYQAKLAQITAGNKAKQDAYDKALTDYKVGKLDVVTDKEKVLRMDVGQVPEGVTIKPTRTIEKNLTNSTNLTADMKAAEDEFKKEETSIKEKLNTYSNTPIVKPVDPTVRSLVEKELKAAKDWADAQNKLGQPIGIKYVIKERVVTGQDATVDAVKAAYDKAKKQMDNDALVSQHFNTTSGGYDWVGSKNRFLQKWADIRQTYEKALSVDAAKESAKLNRPLKVVNYDITKVNGYDIASKTTATGPINEQAGVPQEVNSWSTSVVDKRRELHDSALTSVYDPDPSKFTIVDPDTYKKKVDEFNKQLPALQAQVDAYNNYRKKFLSTLLVGDMNSILGTSDSGDRVLNNNNMKFTKSSYNVKYLRSQPFSTLEDAMKQGFDIANYANSESPTPIENQIAKVKFTAVRIPRGESVTVEYTRKDGKDYMGANDWTRNTMFVRDSDYAKKDTFTEADGQSLNKIRYTIRNDGSISSNGDLIAFFMNDTAIPAYFGISNEGSPEGSNRFVSMQDARQLYGLTTTTEFLNDKDETLRTTLSELSISYPDKNDPSTLELRYNQRYIKGVTPTVDSASIQEYVSRPDSNAGIADHGVKFGNNLIHISQLNNLASNWKDTESWLSDQTGWDGAKLVTHKKSYAKPLVTKALNPDGSRYRISEAETGYFNAESYQLYRSPGVPEPSPFPYASNGGTYISARPVGEVVRTIEVPVVRNDMTPTQPREITPVKMVIKYKEVQKGTEPIKPTLEQLPTAPQKANKLPLPTAPTLTLLPTKPVKGVVPVVNQPSLTTPRLPEKPTSMETKPLPIEPLRSPDPVLKLVTTTPGRPELLTVQPPVVPNINPKVVFVPNVPGEVTSDPKKPELLQLLPKVGVQTDLVNMTRGSVVVKKYVFEYSNSSKGISASVRKLNDKKSSYGNSLILRNLN